mgnify:CR=1 FL=1
MAADLGTVWHAATTGAVEAQHRLVDAETDPAGSESHTTEALVRLPGCFVCYRVPAGTPEPGTTPREDRAFTFGSFNALLKLCDRTVALWADVLKACPGTRLFIKTGALSEEGTRDHTRSRFAAHEFGPDSPEARSAAVAARREGETRTTSESFFGSTVQPFRSCELFVHSFSAPLVYLKCACPRSVPPTRPSWSSPSPPARAPRRRCQSPRPKA